jgi:competence protein ComEC
MQFFNSTPFLRVIMPYIFGIIFNIYVFSVSYKVAWVLFILMSIAFLFTCFTTYKRIQTYSRFVLLMMLDLLLFFTAALSCHLFNPITTKQFVGNYYSTEPITFTALVSDIPNQTKRGIKLNLEVKQLIKYKKSIPITGLVLAYIPINKNTQAIQVNDELAFSCKLFPIDAPKNPQAFNFQQYTHDMGISYICYPDSNDILPLKINTSLSFYQYGLKAKNVIRHFLKASALTPNSQSICNALLTGYDADVEQPIIDGFATTGTLHVLSVSGLHVGIIYLFLNFLLVLIDKYNTQRLLRFVFITACLWFFAFISGFEAPILRAVIMFNILGLGELLYPHRPRNALNAVMCSAFLLLLFNPYLIRNGGFLLSYFAVLGLLTIHPWLEKKWTPENGILKLIWTNTSISIAASIATVPITLYYFHFFPLWFIPCNLMVLPVSYAVMALIPFMLLAEVYAAFIINYLINFLIQFNAFFSQLSLKNMIYVQLSYMPLSLVLDFVFITNVFGVMLLY